MTILFIAKPLSERGNGVVSAIKNELLYLQKAATVALYNIGVPLEKDIAEMVFSVAEYQKIKQLPTPFNKPDLVVFEEVYKIEYIKLYNECLCAKIPYVIIPHGCLVDLEQNKKKLKHQVANLLLFNRFIKKACAVQYLNEQERSVSHFTCRKTIIIPNSIEMKERMYTTDPDCFKFIYVGRYDIVVKGLDLLVDTFIGLRQWCRENHVTLALYGPIDVHTNLELLQEKIRAYHCHDFITINGPVYGEEKEKNLQEASVFIQTSRNEGQPMGIIEALSFGLPCVVTYATSFGAYCNEQQCGIGVNFSQEELAHAIQKIYLDKAFWQQCCQNASACIQADFDIHAVTKRTLELYEQFVQAPQNSL